MRSPAAAGLLAVACLCAGPAAGQSPPAGTPSPPASSAPAGTETCLGCHEEAAKTLVHHGGDPRDAECETCHGPGKAHADAGGDPSLIRRFTALSPPEQTAACLTCHDRGNARFWAASAHARSTMSCLGCHQIHTPAGHREGLLARGNPYDTCTACHQVQRTQAMRSSHMALRPGQDKISCGDCHNPHGSASEAMLRDNSIQENCYRCHADKRGPVLFEHPPVRENCLNCHTPHGSIHESLLVSKQPRLCQNCHIHSRHPSEPRTATNRFAFNRSCVNCHTSVHGSNHPSGVRQMR